MRFLRWFDTNGLLVLTILLIVFIPLYPKVPLVSLTYTWVSVRWDDVLVAVTIALYIIQLIRGKAYWKTPVSWSIFAYWIVGVIATVLGVIFIFPHFPIQFTNMPSVYGRNAALYFLRHIEYMMLLFVAYSSIKDKKQVKYIIGAIVITVTLVVLYGFGQRFFPIYFPAFSTMNEEFAKGQILFLNATDRLQSTFAGHYDLAAYLVMMIPLLGSLAFGYRKWKIRFFLIILSVASLFILLWTASRTSFVAYLIAMVLMLIFQKQKKWILPVLVVSLILLFSFQNIWTRYASTVERVNAVYDSRGNFIGFGTVGPGGQIIINKSQQPGPATQPGTVQIGGKKHVATVSGVVINTKTPAGTASAKTETGTYTIQQQQTLDISVTTRLQSEWPNAIKAWLRDPLFGSGFSSVGLATDGNYFRILAETGLLGMITFLAVFFYYAKYVWVTLPKVNSSIVRSFALGVSAGIVGIGANAVLIDVFEASKDAYILWMLMGLTLIMLRLYAKKSE